MLLSPTASGKSLIVYLLVRFQYITSKRTKQENTNHSTNNITSRTINKRLWRLWLEYE